MKNSLKTEKENISLKEQKKALEKIVSFLEEKKEKEIFEKIEAFHARRIDKIEKNDIFVSLRKGAKVIFHLIPFNSFVSPKNYDLLQFHGKHLELKSLRDTGYYSQTYDFDGLIYYHDIAENGSLGYVHFFTNGIIEVVNIVRSLESLERTNMSLPVYILEEQIMDGLKNHLYFLKEKLKVDLPIIFYLSLLGVEKCKIPRPDSDFNFDDEEIHDFGRKILNFSKIIIDTFDIVPEKILKATFDKLWNAGGHPRSLHYNDTKEWIKR